MTNTPDGAIQAPPPPRTRWRWVRRLGALVAIVIGLFLVLHLPVAQRLLRPALQRAASAATGGTVTVSSLEFNLWTGQVHATGVQFNRPGLDATSVSLDVQVRPRQGFIVRVTEPRVVVSMARDGTPAPPNQQPWTVLDSFAAIDVDRGTLRVQGDDGTPVLQLEGVQARASRGEGGLSGTVAARRIAVSRPGDGWQEAADARLDIDLPNTTRALHLRSGQVVVGQSLVTVTGALQQTNPLIAEAQVAVPTGMSLLRALVPDAALEGEIASRIDVVADRSGRRASLVADAMAVRVAGVGPWDGRIRARVDGDVLRLDDIDLQAYGGSLRGDGSVTLDGATSQLRASVRGVDLPRVLTAHAAGAVRVASRADADLVLRMSQWNPRTLTTDGTVTFRPLAGPGVPLRGSARLRVADRRVRVSTDALHLRDASLSIQGTVGFDGRMDVRYAVRLADVSSAAAVLADFGVDVPHVGVRGALAVDGTVTGALDQWAATARLVGARFAVDGIDVGVESELRATPTSVELVSLTATGANGVLSARGDIPMRDTDPWRIDGTIDGLRLDDVLARHGVPIHASSSGRFAVTGPRREPELTGTIQAEASIRTAATGPPRAPMHVDAAVRATRGGVVVERFRASGGAGTLAGEGRWFAGNGGVEARVQASELPLTAISGLVALPGLESALTGEMQIAGTLPALSGRGFVSATRTTWRGSALPDLRVDVSSDGREITLQGAVAQKPLLAGRMPLVSPWPLHVDVDLGALPLDDLMGVFLPRARDDAFAAMSGRARVDVDLADPSGVRYEARIDSARGQFTQPWEARPFAVRGTLDAVSVEDLEMQFGIGRLRIAGQVGLGHDASGQLVIAGAAPLSYLALLTPVEEAGGEAHIDVTLTGRVARPTVAGTVRVAGGLVRYGPLLVDDIELDAALDVRNIELRHASARVAGGQVRATGAVALQQPTADRYRLELHAQGVDLAQLMAPRDNAPDITAIVDADIHVVADRLSLADVRGDGSLTSLSIAVAGRTLRLDAPVAMAVRSGRLTHAPVRLAGSGGGVTLESAVAIVDGQAQGTLNVDGEIDLVVANPMLGDSVALSGVARVLGRVELDADGWHAHGDARVDNGRAVSTDPAIVVTNVTVALRAEGDRVDVVEGAARLGDGTLAVTGGLVLSTTGPDVDLVLRADRVPLAYPAGLRTRSSGQLRFTGRSGAYQLAGEVVVHQAVSELEDVRPAPALDRVRAALTAFEGRGSLRDRTRLDIGIRLEDGVRVASSQVSAVVDGAVRVAGTALTPEVGGSLAFREGSSARISRATVRLEAGRVELSGYPARPPELEVRGTTQVSGVFIDVSLSGPVDDIRIELSSRNRSDLSQGDLATLMLTGRTTSAAVSESVAIVAEELASSLGRVLDRQVGGFVMIDLSPDDSLIPENTNSALRMNVGIPLGQRLYVIYSRSLNAETARWVVDFRPGGNFHLRVISNDDGSEAVEVSHRFSADLWSRRPGLPAPRTSPRIGRLTVEGVSGDQEAQLRSRMRLAPGDEFDHFRSLDAARTAQAWLVAQGYLEAAVDIHDQSVPGAGVDLTVHVVRGPLVRIEWRGDDPGRSLRARVKDGWSGVLPRDERAARLAREVRLGLQGARYFAAAVTADVTVETVGTTRGEGASPTRPVDEAVEEVRVTFDVARGPRGAGVDLQFEGNAALPNATLAAALPARNTADFFALLEPEGSRRLAAALGVAYATEGFLDMRAGTPVWSFAGAGDRFTVTFPIVEGDRANVVALELPEEVRSAGVDAPALALSEGERFLFDGYASDRARLQDWFRNEGYPDARVTSILEPRPDGLAVRFQADTGPRVTMGGLRRARDGRTRERVLENALATTPGEVIRASDLDESRRRLMQTGIFRSVDLRLMPVDGREDVRDVVVDVLERNDVSVEYSLRYTRAGQAPVGGAPSESRSGLQVGAGVEFVSPFGFSDRYRVSGLLGQERRQLNARYDRATFLGWNLPTELFLFDDRRLLDDVSGLNQRVTGATFEQSRGWRSGVDGRRLHERLRMQWGYTFKQIAHTDYARAGVVTDGLRAGPIHSIVSDTRDSITDPQRGVMWSLGTELALVGLGSDVNYLKTFGQVYVFVPLLPRVTWAQGYRVGVVPGANPFLLLDSRFFAGGSSSVRGFAENSLGPRAPDGLPIGGQASAIFNQELRFPLWKRLHAGVFYDAGNAFGLASEFDLSALRQSAGAGLRFMFPFGPVRLDWSHVIGRQPGEQPSRVVFSIGHAF